MINKEQITALVCLLILVVGVFNLLNKLNTLPKVPLLVVESEFQSARLDPAEVLSEIGESKRLKEDWTPGEIMRDPWKEIGLWTIPPLEDVPPPPSLPSRGFLLPQPNTPSGFITPLFKYEKEPPKKVEEKEEKKSSENN